MRRFATGCTVALLLAGCGSDRESIPDSTSRRSAVSKAIVLPEVGIRFEPPARWSRDRLVVRQLGADSAAAELAGAAHGVTFDYKAEQPGNRNRALLRLLVFDRERWAAHRAEDGPDGGEAIDSVGDWVYVASLPGSNPYREESLDADQFDAMHLSIDEVRKAFAVEGDGPGLARR